MKNRQSKTKTPADEKLETQDFNLFQALEAIDKKDYGYYDRLTPEQQKKFSPYMMIKWACSVKASHDIQGYYLRSIDYYANQHFLNYMITKKENPHPKLQWLMLCAASPGVGKQYREWIPHIKESVTKLRDRATVSEIKEFYKKIYPKVEGEDIEAAANEFVRQHDRKLFLAKIYPGMKIDDIEHLNGIITDDDIEQYKKETGES